jgi:hypothetical protein
MEFTIMILVTIMKLYLIIDLLLNYKMIDMYLSVMVLVFLLIFDIFYVYLFIIIIIFYGWNVRMIYLISRYLNYLNQFKINFKYVINLLNFF